MAYDGAVGHLIGEPNQGMRYMFTMMNNARLSVGLEGLALGERAYQDALQYAQERQQGRAPGTPPGETSFIVDLPDVRRMLLTMKALIDAVRAIVYTNAQAIDLATHHPDVDVRQRNEELVELPDVRRMLLTMKALIDAVRAIVYTNAQAIDLATHHPDDDVRRRNEELVELLTPVSKGFGTDMGIEVTSLAIQVYGGMGYIEESGVPQHFRDARITAIYEGTNGIQAMDLVGRKLPMRGGAVMADFLKATAALDGELAVAGDDLALVRERLAGAVDVVTDTVGWLSEHGLADVRNALAGATPFLRMFGLLVGGRYLAEAALAAKADLDAGIGDADHLEARIVIARFYAANLLPAVAGLAPAVTAGFDDLYAVGPGALAG